MCKALLVIVCQVLTFQAIASIASKNDDQILPRIASKPNSSVCYPVVGCFDNKPPFDNAEHRLPESPDKIGTEITLYTRQNTNKEVIDYKSVSSVYFRPDRPTKVVIHGFSDGGSTPWVSSMKDALIKAGDYNIILVGWEHGAAFPYYLEAAANLRLVATQVKIVLDGLQKQGLKLDDVHIIGHSLGAHMAGFVGYLYGGNTISRISGMDPAQPNFENLSTVVRLDKSDAKFVDVIHTDSKGLDGVNGGYGLHQQSGHVDFYANSGADQPGCGGGLSGLLAGILGGLGKRGILDELSHSVACSHMRAHFLYEESILSNCTFDAYPCPSYEEFEKGNCLDCSTMDCVKFGFHEHTASPDGSMYWFNTFATSPYCGHQYHTYLENHADIANRTDGSIYIALVGDHGVTEFELVTNENEKMTASTTEDKLMLFKQDVGPLQAIRMKWVQDPNWTHHGHVYHIIDEISVKSGKSGQSYTTCSGKHVLKTGEPKDVSVIVLDQNTPASCLSSSVVSHLG